MRVIKTYSLLCVVLLLQLRVHSHRLLFIYRTVDRFDPAVHGAVNGKSILSAIWSFVGNFGSSFFLGSSVGCFTALVTKYTHIRDYPVLETAFFVLLSYATFFLSEAVGLPGMQICCAYSLMAINFPRCLFGVYILHVGIVALLFCGVTQAHYTFNNLSRESQVWTKQVCFSSYIANAVLEFLLFYENTFQR